MGILLLIWRKKVSTIEVLEGLDKEIASFEKIKRQILQQQEDVVGRLVVWSIALYVVLAVIIYLFSSPVTNLDKVSFSLPYIGFPLIVWLLKRHLHWYFVNRFYKNEAKLATLRYKKFKTLEEVMVEEAYNKAIKILEKFCSEGFQQIEKSTAKSIRERSTSANPGVREPSLPIPISPRRRSVVDKLVDFPVGESLIEEFEFIAFRCCYYAPNPARKLRPVAPRLPVRTNIPELTSSAQGSDEGSDTDDDDVSDSTTDDDVSDFTTDVDLSASVNGKVSVASCTRTSVSVQRCAIAVASFITPSERGLVHENVCVGAEMRHCSRVVHNTK